MAERVDSAALSSCARSTQRLGASERFFVALRRFTPINVTRVVALQGRLPPAELARALAALEARHPLLRAYISSDGRAFEYGAGRALRLQLIVRRDDQHFREVLEQVLNSQLARETGSLFALYYLYSERSQRAELILAGEHSACDGISMNQLCAELLALAARAAPIEVRARRPVLECMLPAYSPWARLVAFATSLGKLARLSLNRGRSEPMGVARSSAFDALTLSQHETALLVARARAERTTVTGALMAGVLLTLREKRPELAELALSLPINLRSRLPEHDLTAEDLGNYTSAAYLTSDARGDLWALARTLRGALEREIEGDRLLAAAPLVYRVGRLLVRRGGRPVAHVMLSNSGQVPLRSDYGSFRPMAFFSATSAPMLSADLSLFCNTFEGRLTINLLFSPELLSRAEVVEIGARLRGWLVGAHSSAPGLFTAA